MEIDKQYLMAAAIAMWVMATFFIGAYNEGAALAWFVSGFVMYVLGVIDGRR